MGTNVAYNEDCLVGLAKLPDESIDLTVTSPPYDNLRNYHGFQFDAEKTISMLYSKTKLGGVVVWIVNDATINGSETGTSFRQTLYAMDCGFHLHDTMIWAKDGGGAVGSSRCYTQNTEYMFVWSKGVPKSVNLIKDKENKSFGKNNKQERRRADGTLISRQRRPNEPYSKRNNWWYLVPQKQGRLWHPAVFPYALARDHIITWSNEGDLVCDPFLGSGTTRMAAYDLKRDFVGFEIDKEYFEKQEEAFLQHMELEPLFK